MSINSTESDRQTVGETKAGVLRVKSSFKGAKFSKTRELEVRQFLTKPAVIKASYGLTINRGNYESARIDVGIELPCYVEEIADAYSWAWDKLTDEMQEQIEGMSKQIDRMPKGE